MKELINALGVWKVPACVITAFIIIFIFMQVTGEIIEWCGKVSPEILKIRKYLKRKKQEKRAYQKAIKVVAEQSELLEELKTTLNDFKAKYSADNINKRNKWIKDVDDTMQWVHARAEIYDKSIEKLSGEFAATASAIISNTELTEEIFIQNSRDRIIDFAARAGDFHLIISREEFNRIFKVYARYEEFLQLRKKENGEVETNYSIIKEGYNYRVKNHCFLEDIRADLNINKK